jgi:hypothetical protein
MLTFDLLNVDVEEPECKRRISILDPLKVDIEEPQCKPARLHGSQETNRICYNVTAPLLSDTVGRNTQEQEDIAAEQVCFGMVSLRTALLSCIKHILT